MLPGVLSGVLGRDLNRSESVCFGDARSEGKYKIHAYLRLSERAAALLDHLVGAGLQRERHGKPERPGRFEVDHQLEFGRLLNRQFAGFGAF
jgi:hypothetical protein